MRQFFLVKYSQSALEVLTCNNSIDEERFLRTVGRCVSEYFVLNYRNKQRAGKTARIRES